MNVQEKYGLDPTGQTDNSFKLAQMAADVAAMDSKPSLVFPNGIYAFEHWPNLAYNNLKIVADGHVILKHTGIGAAVIFDGGLTYPAQEPGADNVTFDGFEIHVNQGNGLVINACHRSKFDVIVKLNQANVMGIVVNFAVLTQITPRVNGGGFYGTGLVLDAWPGNPNLQSTACTIWHPMLEGLNIGTWIKNAGSCRYFGGSIESCSIVGARVDVGGHNAMFHVEMEGNGSDVAFGSDAHDNYFWLAGSPKNFSYGSFFANNRVTT